MSELVDNPKPPFELFRLKEGVYTSVESKQGKIVVCCGECGKIYSDHGLALDCCKQPYCGCGNKKEKHFTCCDDCRSRLNLSKRISEEISEFDGALFSEAHDKYFDDVETFLDWAHFADKEDLPEWLYPCNTEGFGMLDADSVVESRCCEMFEDAYDALVDLDGLQTALNEWCKKQTVSCWIPDFSKKISVAKIMEANQ